MSKSLTRRALAPALILIVLLVVVLLQPTAPGIRMGKPLPPGKVKPQLVHSAMSALLLAPDGSLWGWGVLTFPPQKTPSLKAPPLNVISPVPLRIGADSDWSQAACGWNHTVALEEDGSLWAWGANGEGEIGQGNFTNSYSTPTRIGADTNWTEICAGMIHNLALKNDGSLWAWGDNGFSQLGDGTTNNRSVPTRLGPGRDWKMIAADDASSFALKSNGTVWGWGWFSGNWNVGVPMTAA